jgi:flavin-dependent dehydrogenase
MVRVVGGGPAGVAAAIAALAEGANVELYEQAPVPRRKVCGEFLSPGVLTELDRLGLRNQCAGVKPAIFVTGLCTSANARSGRS